MSNNLETFNDHLNINNTNTNTNTNINLLFKSNEHLAEIIYKYRNVVYSDIEINEDIITHLVDNFILKDHNLKFKYSRIKRNIFLFKTLGLLVNNFQVEYIDIATDIPIGKGSYSKVFLSKTQGQVVKLMKSRIENDVFMFDLTDSQSNEAFWQFIIDMFTYILWKSIFTYAFDQDITKINYASYICDIKRPVIIYDRIKPNFCIGYCMKHHYKSMCKSINDNTTIIDNYYAMKLLSDIATMLKNFQDLKMHGVTILHRDLSTNNIMIDQNTIKLIDFGFALTSIEFADNTNWKIGEFFDDINDDVIEPFHDVVFFILFALIYHAKLLSRLNIYSNFRRLIMIDFNYNLINLSEAKSLWSYPYNVKFVNYSTLLDRFMNIFKNNTCSIKDSQLNSILNQY